MNTYWKEFIQKQSQEDYYKNLEAFLDEEYANKTIYPPKDQLYQALELTPFEKVQVVIVGQDPYYNPNQANGLAFSVERNQPLPQSLINIYKELEDDLGIKNTHGDLTHWAKQGVLLLNTCLSVEHGYPLSHKNKGWETFTDLILDELGKREDPIIFILWGNQAKKKQSKINDNHYIITSAHPSPLSVYRGFWNSKPFSKTNQYLLEQGKNIIDWSV